MKNTIALISVDNTRTFEDKKLRELYVPGGEVVAQKTKQAVDIVKEFGGLTVNVFDNHPKGHILFASSYKCKVPFDMISYEEVKHRTAWDHGLSDTASFTVDQLKAYLNSRPKKIDRLWPEHGKSWTVSRELMTPLTNKMFDVHLAKGHEVDKHPYGGFVGTGLSAVLRNRSINTVFITGVATDYCSGQTVEEALLENFTTYFITDATAALDEEAGKRMIDELKDKGALMITVKELRDVLTALQQ